PFAGVSAARPIELLQYIAEQQQSVKQAMHGQRITRAESDVDHQLELAIGRAAQFTFLGSVGGCSDSGSVGAGSARSMMAASSSSDRSRARRNCPASVVLSCGGLPAAPRRL